MHKLSFIFIKKNAGSDILMLGPEKYNMMNQ